MRQRICVSTKSRLLNCELTLSLSKYDTSAIRRSGSTGRGSCRPSESGDESRNTWKGCRGGVSPVFLASAMHMNPKASKTALTSSSMTAAGAIRRRQLLNFGVHIVRMRIHAIASDTKTHNWSGTRNYKWQYDTVIKHCSELSTQCRFSLHISTWLTWMT